MLGLLLGFAAGWVVSRWADGASPPRDDPSAIDAVPVAGADSVRLTGAAAQPAESTGSTTPSVETLRTRLDSAKRSSDGEALVSNIRDLARLDTPAADEALLAIVRDPAMELPPEVAQALQGALKHAPIEGVAEAAKARFALRLAAGYGPDRAGAGWFALIGAHEGKAALDWAREEGWHEHEHDPLWKELVTGFLSSSHPSVLPFARELARTEQADHQQWPVELRRMEFFRLAMETWARLDPAEALPAIVEEIERQLRRDRRPAMMNWNGLVWIYVRRLPDDQLHDAAALIRRIAEQDHSPQGWASLMFHLHARGMSLDALEDVILIPTTTLEQMAASGGPQEQADVGRVQNARQVILRYPWMWSDRSLEAVEGSIEWERWPADREVLRALLLEARTKRRWSGEPAR